MPSPRKIKYRLPIVTHEMRIRADELRHNMTESERKLWSALRSMPGIGKFHRQRVVGKYIVDFVSLEHGIVLEIDGSQRVQQISVADDTVRDSYLNGLGFKVLRFATRNVEVNVTGVIEGILRELEREDKEK